MYNHIIVLISTIISVERMLLMKKSVITLLLIAVITILSLNGCSPTNPTENDGLVSQNYAQSTDNKKILFDLSALSETKYSEGVVWLRYTENDKISSVESENNFKYGCVDKSGKMLFYTEASKQPMDFHNGYTHIETNDGTTVSVVDKNGKIHSSYNKLNVTDYGNSKEIVGNETYYCVAYGYGFSVVQEQHSDFDASYYEYKVFDADAKKLFDLKIDEETEVKHLGQGVFVFKNQGMFFSKSRKWKEYEIYNEFDDEAEMIYYDTDYDDSDDTARLKFLTAKGKLITSPKISRADSGLRQATSVYKYICFVKGNDYYIYDLSQNIFNHLNETKYSDKISGDSTVFLEKNRLIITMHGEDDNLYAAVFDKKWNVIMKPIQCDNISESSERIIIDLDKVYDLDGNQLFTLSNNGYKYLYGFPPSYSNDVLLVEKTNNADESKIYAALDLNGKELYNTQNLAPSSKHIK